MKLVFLEIILLGFIAGHSCVSNDRFPYQVSLQHKVLEKHFCSGAILTESWILTSARCVIDYDIEEFCVNYGVQRFTFNAGCNRLKFKIVHSKYDVMKNDIAMLGVAEKIQFQPNVISPIALPEAETIYGEAVTVSGWDWEGVSSFFFMDLKPSHLFFFLMFF